MKTARAKARALLSRDEPEVAARRGPCPPRGCGLLAQEPAHGSSATARAATVKPLLCSTTQLSEASAPQDAAAPRLPWGRLLTQTATSPSPKPRATPPPARLNDDRSPARTVTCPSSPARTATASAPHVRSRPVQPEMKTAARRDERSLSRPPAGGVTRGPPVRFQARIRLPTAPSKKAPPQGCSRSFAPGRSCRSCKISSVTTSTVFESLPHDRRSVITAVPTRCPSTAAQYA